MKVEQAIVHLYDEYAVRLHRYAVSLTHDSVAAQDAVQEVFLRYAVMLRAGRPVATPKAWLFRVLRNHLLDLTRASRSRNEVGLEELPDRPDNSEDPEQRYASMELSRQILDALTPRELECLRLRSEGMRYSEIAEVLSVHTGTVATLLSRCGSRIRQLRSGAWKQQGRQVAAEDSHAS